MWCCYMLRYIAAQPFREVLFSVCSSRAVLTKQIITQSCLVMLGWVSVLHNHAEVSVVLFIHPPPRCSWHGCAAEREVFTYFCPCCGWSQSLLQMGDSVLVGEGWPGNDTSPSCCRKFRAEFLVGR